MFFCSSIRCSPAARHEIHSQCYFQIFSSFPAGNLVPWNRYIALLLLTRVEDILYSYLHFFELREHPIITLVNRL